MDCMENKIPLFNGRNYVLWSVRMKAYVQAQGFDVWHSVMVGYKEPSAPPTDDASKKLYQSNAKAMNAILNGLTESVYFKIMHCTSAKEVWDKLQNIYEGDKKVEESNLQTFRGQFEQLRMNEDENIAENRIPLFNGENYVVWSGRMKAYVKAQGFDVWHSVMTGYKKPLAPPIDDASKKLYESNAKAMNAILGSLTESMFFKVMHCTSAKEAWDKLQNIYEGYKKVREAKLDILKRQFYELRMNEDENIASYFLRVDEVTNAMQRLGGPIENKVIVQQVLWSLPMRFEAKVSALEERPDIENVSMDELHRILTAYEMRTKQENPSKREASFTTFMKTGKNKQQSKPSTSSSCSDTSDEEITNFVRKLKRGTGKYKDSTSRSSFGSKELGFYKLALDPRLFAVKDDCFCLFEGALENLPSLRQQYRLSKSVHEVVLVIEAHKTFRHHALILRVRWLDTWRGSLPLCYWTDAQKLYLLHCSNSTKTVFAAL